MYSCRSEREFTISRWSTRPPARPGTTHHQPHPSANSTKHYWARPHPCLLPHNRRSSGCRRAGEGWAGGPSRRDAKRPSGDRDRRNTAAGWEAAPPASARGARAGEVPRTATRACRTSGQHSVSKMSVKGRRQHSSARHNTAGQSRNERPEPRSGPRLDRFPKPCVAGSNPAGGTSKCTGLPRTGRTLSGDRVVADPVTVAAARSLAGLPGPACRPRTRSSACPPRPAARGEAAGQTVGQCRVNSCVCGFR